MKGYSGSVMLILISAICPIKYCHVAKACADLQLICTMSFLWMSGLWYNTTVAHVKSPSLLPYIAAVPLSMVFHFHLRGAQNKNKNVVCAVRNSVFWFFASQKNHWAAMSTRGFVAYLLSGFSVAVLSVFFFTAQTNDYKPTQTSLPTSNLLHFHGGYLSGTKKVWPVCVSHLFLPLSSAKFRWFGLYLSIWR